LLASLSGSQCRLRKQGFNVGVDHCHFVSPDLLQSIFQGVNASPVPSFTNQICMHLDDFLFQLVFNLLGELLTFAAGWQSFAA
jgi:hypothetical protein